MTLMQYNKRILVEYEKIVYKYTYKSLLYVLLKGKVLEIAKEKMIILDFKSNHFP